jgi:hypothetical protein
MTQTALNKLALASLLTLGYAAIPLAAHAASNADCEIVLMETISDDAGRGEAQVASYRPAKDFLISVYEKGAEPIRTINGEPIKAVMCKRADIIPTKKDFPIVATGIPFFLSQSFESQDTDLVTIFYKDGTFQQSYKGPGLSSETQTLLTDRLAMFDSMKAAQQK